MRELVEKLTIYKGDKYSGAFHDPVDQNACTELRNDKRANCHPNNDPKLSYPKCMEGMSEEELIKLYNTHMTCRNFRALENSSKCFSKMDKGHKNAQRFELTEANHCMQLLEKLKVNRSRIIPQVQSQNPTQSQNHHPNLQSRSTFTNPFIKKSEIEENQPEMVGENQPEMDEKELRKQKRLDNKKLKKASFWRSVIFYVLFFVAFCLFSLFLFYVY